MLWLTDDYYAANVDVHNELTIIITSLCLVHSIIWMAQQTNDETHYINSRQISLLCAISIYVAWKKLKTLDININIDIKNTTSWYSNVYVITMYNLNILVSRQIRNSAKVERNNRKSSEKLFIMVKNADERLPYDKKK